MNTQIEAERLADCLETHHRLASPNEEAAAELRRLVSFNKDLIEEVERLNKALQWEQNRAERIGTHGPGCHTWGSQHYECLLRVNAELVEALKELVYETETVSIGDYSEEAHDIAVSKARAALAKATGGTK
jgi:hypothetical protein